jgi:drug/metabolite transporter (DMT)-like permease
MQPKERKLNLIGQLLLLLATLAWGTSFFILKDAIEKTPAFFVLAIRFVFAGLIFCCVFYKKFKRLTKSTFFMGVILGIILFLAYVTQTEGLKLTTPGRNAFLTSSYCVMCPFLLFIIFRVKPTVQNVISAVLCIVGVGLVALSGDSGAGKNTLLGDGLTLIGAVFFSLQIIAIDKFQKKGADTILLLIFELLTVGVLCIISSLIFELPVVGIGAYELSIDQIIRIGYLTLACTLFAQFAQIFGQKFTTANQSAIILSLEAVFGVLFSVLFAGEKLTAMIIVGFVVIFVSILTSEVRIDFRKKLLNTVKNEGKENE